MSVLGQPEAEVRQICMGGGGVQVEVEVGAWAAVELIVVDG